MRLLVITQAVDLDDPILGFFHRWLEELASRAERVEVLCLVEGRHALPANVHVRSLGKDRGASRAGYVTAFYRAVVPLLAHRRVDRVLVHMNEVYVLLLAPLLPLRRARGIRLVWWKTHGHLSRGSRAGRHFVDAILTASDESFPIATGRKVVLGHGIDTEAFAPLAGAARDEQELLCVGRLSTVKHLEDAIRAVALLPAGQRLRLVGPPGREPGYRDELERLVGSLGLDGRVSFEPPRPHAEMPGLLGGAGILVSTSETDSLDKVVLEAMACGTIPVTSNPAFRATLAPFGLTVPKHDPEALAAAIARVQALDEAERTALRARLRSLVVEHHDLRRLAPAILSA